MPNETGEKLQPGANGLHSTFVSNVELYENTTTSSSPIVLLQIQGEKPDKVVDTKLKEFLDKAKEIERNRTANAEKGTTGERGNANNGEFSADNPDIRFSAGRKTAGTEAVADPLREGLNMEIDVSEGGGRKMRKGKDRGYYNEKTGRLVINAGAHTSRRDVERTVLVTGLGNKGLRATFGKGYDDFLNAVYENSGEEVRREIAALAYRCGDG